MVELGPQSGSEMNSIRCDTGGISFQENSAFADSAWGLFRETLKKAWEISLLSPQGPPEAPLEGAYGNATPTISLGSCAIYTNLVRHVLRSIP